jgi:hypothetical protein
VTYLPDSDSTKEKICEALYFLDRMSENQRNLSHFKYNLSAFVSASFSITQFLKTELDSRSGFNEWYDNELLPWIENDGMMKLLWKARRITIHIQRIPTRVDLTLREVGRLKTTEDTTISISEINADGSVGGTRTHHHHNQEDTASAAADEDNQPEIKWYFEKNDEIKNIPDIDSILHEDIITICTSCFKELTRRISDYDQTLFESNC